MTNEDVDEEEPLSPMARVFQSPGVDNCIITFIGFKNKIIPNLIIDGLKHNVYKHPRFCSKLSDNCARWIKTKVNVEEHVYAPHIDPEEINQDGEEFIDDYVLRLTMNPLDRSRPLWDIHILNVKTSDAEAVCVVRCHHSIGDGMSLMSLLVACTRKTSDPESFPTVPTIKRREKLVPHHLRNKCYILRSIYAIYSAMRLTWDTFVDFLLFLATISFLKDTKTPLKKGAAGVENTPRKFYHRTVSLNDIRLIKNAMKMTINDVILGVTQAALSRYLNRRYANTSVVDGTSTSDQNNLPGGIRLQAGVAVNLRQKIGIQPVEEMLAKGSKCRWGNYNNFIHFPLFISLETDPLVHLLKTKSIMDRKKHSLLSAHLYSIGAFIYNVFGLKVGPVLWKRVQLNTTTFFSNIVGPVEEVSLHGNQIAYIALSAFGNGLSQALLIHFISYADKMIISMAVDPSVIPDPQILCDEMEDSLKDLKDALSNQNYPF